MKFGLIGAAGYVAPRHMSAIKDVGGELSVACDRFDSVGVLDRYFKDCLFFNDSRSFGDFISSSGNLDYLSICSPNFMHYEHAEIGMSAGASIICEKPLVHDVRLLDSLHDMESKYGRSVHSILQMRLHSEADRLWSMFSSSDRRHRVVLNYITPRGHWYKKSWKGDKNKSGGILMNIGIHFFDLLLWVFGGVSSAPVLNHIDEDGASGTLILDNADVVWNLSTSAKDLPPNHDDYAYRCLAVDGHEFDFSSGFEDLHYASYRSVLDGEGFGIEDAAPGILLVDTLNNMKAVGGKYKDRFIYR